MGIVSDFDEMLDAAFAHHQADRLDKAEALYRKALEEDPEQADVLHLLGVVAFQRGNSETAIELIELALPELADLPEPHLNLGNALRQVGRLADAVDSYRRAIALNPDYGMAHSNLAATLIDQDEFAAGLASAERAVELIPDFAGAHVSRGAALLGLERFAEAEAPLRQALALLPDQAEIHNNLGVALQQLDRVDEAIAHFERAAILDPDQARTQKNLGGVLERQGRLEAAMVCYDRALALEPDNPEMHLSRSQLRLLHGDFPRGWADYEWRWSYKDGPRPRDFGVPRWAGEDLHGETILLHAEQGLGDSIQFLRYVPMVAERGAIVVLEVQEILTRLAADLPGAAVIMPPSEPLPGLDLHCPLLSLPKAFDTRLETIPARVPYLTPPVDARAWWASHLGNRTGLKVGLAWAGNPQNLHDPVRSMTLAALQPLLDVRGVHWFSLQVGERAGDCALVVGTAIDDLSPRLTDLAETAAAICHLDLVISVDTAVAHLAGALGRPVWVMLAFIPAWRWLLGREDSPWYPTMRLFRQTRPDDWAGVVREVADVLARLVEERSARCALTLPGLSTRPTGLVETPDRFSVCSPEDAGREPG
jgi:Tfp pilus assembly protein PilF